MAEREIRSTRATRRVLLVLLTGASNLSGYPISRAAATRSGAVYVALWRLERAGWVGSKWGSSDPRGHRRRFYHLTRQGRAKAVRLLGLEFTDARMHTEG